MIGMENFKEKLVAFGADGASVNRGFDGGVRALLEEENPWLLFMWCVAHRLELSLKDALAETCFKDVDEMLLRLFLMYRKSPKKLHQLKEFYDIYKEVLEEGAAQTGGVKPKKASGLSFLVTGKPPLPNG